MREIPEKFLVAFSFAGEQRELVRSIAEAVEQRLGNGSVFYDDWFEHYIAGDDADLRLQEIYGNKAILVVPCVSARYGGKPWTRAEHKAIRSLQMTLDESEDERNSFRILPLRVGDGDIEGIFRNTICPDVRGRPATDTTELIINRLRLAAPHVLKRMRGPDNNKSSRCVFLAECTPDLEDETKPINRERMNAFLEGLGWTVLPNTVYPSNEYQTRLENDVRASLAFIQLLGPYPWKRGGFDRLQNEVAEQLAVKRFRFRSSDIKLENVEPSHRNFLTSPDVISTGFEDFRRHVEKQLTALALRADGYEDRGPEKDNPPLVRVAIRSTAPDKLWEKVFQWFYAQEGILHDQLGPDESFESKHQKEPCHGFMIVCDEAAHQDGPLSPRSDIEQCRQIQLQVKNGAKQPPVGLIYYPPPAPSWPKLLRTNTRKLFTMQGDEPVDLGEFFSEVRNVAK